MVNEDPTRLQNQSCVICEEIVKIRNRDRLVYSSFVHLPTFSIGLSSTKGEILPRARLCESSVDLKDKSQAQLRESSVDLKDKSRARLRESNVDLRDKSLAHYFQMPELGARVFVGDGDGFDTIICHMFDGRDYERKLYNFDSEYATISSFYKHDRPGGLSRWLLAQHVEFGRRKDSLEVILSGTELFVDPHFVGCRRITVGNLQGKSSRVSGSSFDYKDCTGDETIRQPSDIDEQLGDHVPGVYFNDDWEDHWESVEEFDLWRSTQGSYLEKPKFMMSDHQDFVFDLRSLAALPKRDVLQLTRFDDFVILGTRHFLRPCKVIDIVRKNASKTTDVIAQLVKGAMEEYLSILSYNAYPITAIIIFLDHKEILLREVREYKNEKKEHMALKDKATLLGLKGTPESTVLKDDKKIAKLKMFALEIEDKKGIMMEDDYKVKMVGGEHLPIIAQTSTISLEENEVGMKSATISSKLPSATVQDDFEVSSSIALIEEDDCKSKDFMISRHITKWIIYGDLLERTLLCFFNIEEMQYEFYFEDHESMATIIGLGVPSSKGFLECGSLHVIVVEIPKENWDVVWAHSNVIPLSIPKVNVLKQEQFPDILHRIANTIIIDNIVGKANNGGIGGDNGKRKTQGNIDDSEDKAKDHDDHGNTGHPDGSSNGASSGASNDNDNKEEKGKDGNDEEKDNHNQNDGKIFNGYKEVQAVVHLRLLPGGVLEDKVKKKEFDEEEGEGKKKESGEIHEEEIEGKKKEGHEKEGEGKKKALREIYEEEVEEKKN